jgi:hypothetical protein
MKKVREEKERDLPNNKFIFRGERGEGAMIPVSYFTSRKLYIMYGRNFIMYSFP